jgi:hypothetical protein
VVIFARFLFLFQLIFYWLLIKIGYDSPSKALRYHMKGEMLRTYCICREVFNNSMILLIVAVDMVIPPGTPFEGLSRCHPVSLQILKSAFAFAVGSGHFSESLVLARKQIDLTKALELESAMCKTMCAVTLIQLTMGDIVQVWCMIHTQYTHIHSSNIHLHADLRTITHTRPRMLSYCRLGWLCKDSCSSYDRCT